MAPLSARLSRSLRAEPIVSDSEAGSAIDEFSSVDDGDNDSDDSNVEASTAEVSTAENSDIDENGPENGTRRQASVAKKRKRSSEHSDSQSPSSSKRAQSKGSTLPLTGLDSISFGALAAAQASLAQDTTHTAAHDPSHRRRQRTSASSPPPSSPSLATTAINNSKPIYTRSRSRSRNQNHNPSNDTTRTHSRPSKHAPAAMPSTRPVSRRRIVVSGSEPISNANNTASFMPNPSIHPTASLAVHDMKNMKNMNKSNKSNNSDITTTTNIKAHKSRDPRFTPLSGPAPSPATLHRRYAFLDDYRAAETKALQQIISGKAAQQNRGSKPGESNSNSKSPALAVTEETRVAARAALQRHQALARNEQRARAEQELVRAHRRQEREALNKGRKGKGWFLKRGVVRERVGAGGAGGVGAAGAADAADAAVVAGVVTRGRGVDQNGSGKGSGNDHDQGAGGINIAFQNKKKEGRREKRLMKKEKWVMGQTRRRT